MPIARALKGGRGCLRRALNLEKLSLIERASQHAIALLRGGKIMKQLGLGVVVAIGLTLPAFANPPQLKGDYVWTYSDTCLVSPSGFSAPPGLALAVPPL
jgi:hypothetical protein